MAANPGTERSRSNQLTSLPRPPTSDQDQPLAVFGKLVQNCLATPPPKRLSDDRGAFDLEDREQVTHIARLRSEGVVTGVFGGRTVTHEIWGDHGVIAGQERYDLLPRPRAPGYPVDEQDGRTIALTAKSEVVTVDLDMLELRAHLGCIDPEI